MRRITLYVSLVVVLVILCGCNAASPMSTQKEFAAAPPAPTMVPMEMEYEEMAAGEAAPRFAADTDEVYTEPLPQDVSPAQQGRIVIYTGDMSLIVQDTREAAEAITQLAAEQGGYVSNSHLYEYDEVLRGTVTIRVLAENYQPTLEQLRQLAKRVESENTTTQDVTEEYTDLEARKVNLERTEEALQKLLDERQKFGSTEDILEVYRELTNVRGQIEQIEGRMRYLSTQAALSTITIELIPDVLYQPVAIAGWEPRGVAKSALQALVSALQVIATLIIWAIVFLLPILVIIAIPIALIVLLVRWLVKRKKKNEA